MNESKLQDALIQLKREIEKLDNIDESERERLELLLTRIQNTADPNDEETGDDLQENLAEAVTKFETTYPRLTAIMNDIVTTLSNMGI